MKRGKVLAQNTSTVWGPHLRRSHPVDGSGCGPPSRFRPQLRGVGNSLPGLRDLRDQNAGHPLQGQILGAETSSRDSSAFGGDPGSTGDAAAGINATEQNVGSQF